MKHRTASRLALLPLLAALPCACTSGGDGAERGTLFVAATDAPLDPSQVAAASVDVVAVRVHRESDADGEDGGFVTVSEEATTLDLLDLRNGVTEILGSAELEVGRYGQGRIVISGGSIELQNGRVYTTEDGTLRLASQATSGFKVKIEPPIEVVADEERTLLLDFELTKTFRPIPASDPLNADAYSLHPVIRATNMTETGEVGGEVTLLTRPVGGAGVFLMPPGEVDPEQSVASTVTEDDGSFTVLGLPPGTYDVLARHGTSEGTADAVLVVRGRRAVAEIVLE